MKSKFLFPAWCAILGYVMALPGFILGYYAVFKAYEIPRFGFRMRERDSLLQGAFENFTNELCLFMVIGGLVLIAFSRDKREDELNAKLRLNALYWGIMIYYLIYIFGLVYSIFGEIPFIGDHASALNLFAPLLVFMIRFYYLKFIYKEQYLVKEPKFLAFAPFKWVGRVMAVIGLLVFTTFLVRDIAGAWEDPISNISFLCLIFGLMLWAFSKNKVEDEMVMQHRLESLQLAVYFNYALLLLATVMVYSLTFLLVMVIAQFSLLLFFVIRMEYVNYKDGQLSTSTGGTSHEK